MSKPANKTLIGLFVLGAMALLVMAVVVLGSGKFFRSTVKAVLFFEGSIGGLNVGAPVVFNGVRIGSVRDIVLRYDTRDLTTSIPVYIEIDPKQMEIVGPHPESFKAYVTLLIDHGLKARLELQSIVTGTLQIALNYYPDRPVKLLGVVEKYPEIPTIPTPLQEITKRIEQLPVEKIMESITTAVDGISRVLDSPKITKTFQSVSRAAEEAEGLMQNLDSRVDPVSTDVQQTLRQAQNLLEKIDQKTTALTSRIEGAVKQVHVLVQNIDRQVDPLASSLQGALASIEKTSDEAGASLRQARQTLLMLEGDIGEDSELMFEFKKTLKEVAMAAKAARSLAVTLEQQPESIVFGKRKPNGR